MKTWELIRDFDIKDFKYEKSDDKILIYPGEKYIELINKFNNEENLNISIDFFTIFVKDNILCDFEKGIHFILKRFLTYKLYKLVIENEKYLIINQNIFSYPTMRELHSHYECSESEDIKSIYTQNFVLYYIDLGDNQIEILKNQLNLLEINI
jgi:hypothetical protein